MTTKKALALASIVLILVSTFTAIPMTLPAAGQSTTAELTGHVYDYGTDTDIDGLFNSLVVLVEVNVSTAGTYRVEIMALNASGYYYYDLHSNQTYLGTGLRNVSISYGAFMIRSGHLNVRGIIGVNLFSQDHTQLDSLYGATLSQIYYYSMFDTGATFTGTVIDQGIDLDGDGLFESLQVSAQLNVSDVATYEVSVYQLTNVEGSVKHYMDVYNFTMVSLSLGMQFVNVTLGGSSIYASHGQNVTEIHSLYLYGYDPDGKGHEIDSRTNAALSRSYSYDEFETPARFVLPISDTGIDSDGDVKFDYLQITVGFNVTAAGDYTIELEDLMGNASNVINVQVSMEGHYEVGVQQVNMTVYGPTIHMSHINPRYIGSLKIISLNSGQTVDSLTHVSLPVLYDYHNFEAHAFLTGNVSDMGVDTDGDGLFNYLAVGVEVNFTEAGFCEIAAHGLMEVANGSYNAITVLETAEGYFDAGCRMVYLNFSGPMLVYQHFSPTNVTDILLFDKNVNPPVQLGSMSTAVLSHRYSFTDFNAPFSDDQIELTVYPNGTVGVKGRTSSTNMYPTGKNPPVNATISLSTVGNVTTGSANGTVAMPSEWPYDSVTANSVFQYGQRVLNASLDASARVTPEMAGEFPLNGTDLTLNSRYADGMLNVDLSGEMQAPPIPFNVTDLVMLVDYNGNALTGNITLRGAAGFPFSDVVVYMSGNRTNLRFTGNLTVMYGNYFGMEINATGLDSFLVNDTIALQGQGSGSLYNITGGYIECTQFDTVKTPLFSNSTEIGAVVGYNVTANGNFTGFIAMTVSQMFGGSSLPDDAGPTVYAVLESTLSSIQSGSLTLTYYHASDTVSFEAHLASDAHVFWNKALNLVPPTVPAGDQALCEAIMKIANVSAYDIRGFSLNASYSHADQTALVSMWLSANAEQFKNDATPFLPDAVAPELHDIVESFLSTSYSPLDSATASFNCTGGKGRFKVDFVAEGDFEAETNSIKRFVGGILNQTDPSMLPLPLQLLNETEINVNSLQVQLRTGEDWMSLTFEGATAETLKNTIDPIRFKLVQLFNMSAGEHEPPSEFSKLKITVIGGSNATHTVLMDAPYPVPQPDNASKGYRFMAWENTSLSSIKDLLFKIAYEGKANYGGNTYSVPIFTNSTASSFSFYHDQKRISFTVSGSSGHGFCNITLPRTLLYANPSDWIIRVDTTVLDLGNFTVSENSEYVFIYLTYSHSSHTIQVQGTWVVNEYQPNLMLIVLAAASLIVAVAVFKQRKKLSIVSAKYQSAVRMIAARIQQHKT